MFKKARPRANPRLVCLKPESKGVMISSEIITLYNGFQNRLIEASPS